MYKELKVIKKDKPGETLGCSTQAYAFYSPYSKSITLCKDTIQESFLPLASDRKPFVQPLFIVKTIIHELLHTLSNHFEDKGVPNDFQNLLNQKGANLNDILQGCRNNLSRMLSAKNPNNGKAIKSFLPYTSAYLQALGSQIMGFLAFLPYREILPSKILEESREKIFNKIDFSQWQIKPQDVHAIISAFSNNNPLRKVFLKLKTYFPRTISEKNLFQKMKL